MQHGRTAPSRSLTVSELAKQRWEAGARDPDFGLFARMAVALGARRGELAGLRRSAVDLDDGFVRIDTAVVSSDENGSGRRTGRRLTVSVACGGVPLPSVRDRLGHSSLTVTNIYVDGRPEWDRKSAEIIGAVLDATS